MKFKNYIETESGIKDTSTSPGTAGQLLSSTVAGTSWIDQNTISSGSSEVVDIQVKNIASADGGVNLSKGDPVYIYGSVGASARLYVDLADADSTATNNLGDSKMPCVALLDQDLSPNGEGTATVVGKLRNLITNPIDGSVPDENDTVYVKPGGGLTLAKPAGSTNLIQNVGQVGRVSTSADGNIVVAALLRTNDVPNLPEGRLFVGTSANTSLASDVVYVDDTNDRVGIGTTSPDSKLTVDGTTRLGGDVEVSELLSGDKVLTLTANNGHFSIGDIDGLGDQAFISGDSSSISISTNQITTLHCDSNNRVGIGTTTPSYKLDVNGTGRFTDILTSNKLLQIPIAGTTVNEGKGVGLSLTDDFPYVGNDSTTRYLNHYGMGIHKPLQASIAGGNGAYLSGYFGVDIFTAGNSRIHVNQNGNVGIGTTSPNEKLEVAGSARITGNGLDVGYVNNGTNFIQVGNGRTTNGYAYIDLVGDATYTDYGFRIIRNNTGPNTSTELIHRGTGIFNFNATQAADITFKTSNAERIRINSSGNVGIGTTSLTTISSAVATLSLGSTSATTSGGIAFQANGVVKAYNYVSTGYLYNQTVAGIGQIFFGAGSERMRIHNNTGNVGIGTTNPAKKLTIGGIGLGNTDGLKIEDPSNTAYGAHYSYNDGSTTVEIGGVVNNVLRDCISIARDATRTITINTSENVGIGITNPSSKLHVASTVSHSTPLANFDGSVGSGVYGAVSVRVNNINYGTAMKFYRSLSADNNAIAFQNGASTVGSISIGTSSTSYNTTSDYRLKENLTAITDGIDRLRQLKPIRFNFIGNADVVDGFIAHEAKEVIPESVTGEKDEVLPNGDPVYQGIDQSKIVPLLTAALQEAISKIEQLETRIQKLENK